MNNYLYNKIEQAKGGACFQHLIFLPNEICKDQISETFEEFTKLDSREIAKVIGWNTKEETLEFIKEKVEEKELLLSLMQHDKTGFLAQCSMADCTDFRFKEGKGNPVSWKESGGITYIFWVYAESIAEIVEKLIEESDKLFFDMIKSFKKNQSNELDN